MNYGYLIKVSTPFILLLLIIMPVSGQPSGNTTTYSIVHISDTQFLASHYPETYDYTFSYLDSIKERYNISAIIITGDLVDTWNDEEEWEAYSHAVHETSIPICVVVGNHDISDDYDYKFYTQHTGNTNNSYVTSFENFDLIGINSVFEKLKPQEYALLRKTLLNSSKDMTIISTHYYIDENGILSPLGTDISQQLIVKPTIVLSGHSKSAFVRDRAIGQYVLIEDLTNYQVESQEVQDPKMLRLACSILSQPTKAVWREYHPGSSGFTPVSLLIAIMCFMIS
jgi:predicted MPP superfamily phosphohydrolase